MTYNEWRDELKSNLLCVPEAERRRVLDYYAEAYADRRDAGFSEREIIADFGAPYDAAQRILADNPERVQAEENEQRNGRKPLYSAENRTYSGGNREMGGQYAQNPQYTQGAQSGQYGQNPQYAQQNPQTAQTSSGRGDYTWVFVLLCVLFAVPIFIVVMGMVGVTVGLCVSPVAVLISGVATMGAGVGTLFSNVTEGAVMIGTGLVIFGISLILIPLCFKLVQLMWKLFTMFFAWLRKLFRGKEKA